MEVDTGFLELDTISFFESALQRKITITKKKANRAERKIRYINLFDELTYFFKPFLFLLSGTVHVDVQLPFTDDEIVLFLIILDSIRVYSVF